MPPRAPAARSPDSALPQRTHKCAQELVKAKAVEGLLALVREPLEQQQRQGGGAGEAAASPGADGQSPLKIALFSLGNLSAHQECRERLLGAGPGAAPPLTPPRVTLLRFLSPVHPREEILSLRA